MIQKKLVQILLAPFSLLYGLGVSLRNGLYERGVLKGVEFDLPIISVGNLSVGGAGKTPHIEYLIRLLKDYIDIATLSRGYRRKTKGYLEVQPQMDAEQVGDEPLQFKRKFPDIVVSVSESRTFAIPKIIMEHESVKAVLLDDAFQHRSIRPGLNILLTEYSHPFTRDYLLPAGRLREWRSAYERADIIIVSKCPPVMAEEDRQRITEEINPLPHQKLYFSYYEYGQPYFILNPRYRLQFNTEMDALLISAIARTDYLLEHLEAQVGDIRAMEYEDHHYFSKYDIGQLKANFDRMDNEKKVILTTEKDAMRLQLHHAYIKDKQLPIFALPVQVRFHFSEGEQFDEDVRQYLLNFKV